MKAAIAIFVKTPGLSAVKTRLARSIGTEGAEAFYRLSARAVGAVVKQAAGRSGGSVEAFWAVAEPGALDHPDWRGLPTLAQGTGTLGDRLATVQDSLLARAGAAIMIGSDSPQLGVGVLEGALRSLSKGAPFVLGPADDGGFYLFGATRALSSEDWLAVPYSDPGTAAALRARISRRGGEIGELPSHFDVDTFEELRRLTRELGERIDLVPEQIELREWCRERGFASPSTDVPAG